MTIANGDLVLADIDGIVVIPRNIAEEVIDQVETVMQAESLVRKAILEGTSPRQAYLDHGKF